MTIDELKQAIDKLYNELDKVKDIHKVTINSIEDRIFYLEASLVIKEKGSK
jgi:hypothetical protein